MTFSLLAHDRDENAWGGVSATGNLCVGGWVLHGRNGSGICASQGQSPSTLWGNELLDLQRKGLNAPAAVMRVVSADHGRHFRQISAIDARGRAAAFSGESNRAYCGHTVGTGLVATGNILAGPEVLDTMMEAYASATGPLTERLIAALAAAASVGGDMRGTQSAALLRISPDAPPLSLRIDCADDPIAELRRLYDKTTEADYQSWLTTVPTEVDPERSPLDEPLPKAG